MVRLRTCEPCEHLNSVVKRLVAAEFGSQREAYEPKSR